MTDVCVSALNCIYDFQTLASGVLAVGAALVGGAYVLRSSRLPVEAQRENIQAVDRRKTAYVAKILGSEFTRVGELATQAASTIKVVIAANKEVNDTTRAKTIIELHPIIDDIEAMSLLPQDLAQTALDVRYILYRHNFDMRRAGGSFGDDNFRRHVQDQAKYLSDRSRAAGASLQQYSEKISATQKP